MIYKNIKERHEHKIEILSNKIDELEKQNEDLKLQVSLLEDGFFPLKDLNDTLELESFRKLQSEVHRDMEMVWMFDSSFSLTPNEDIKERSELIEKVFYKVANEWID